MNLLQSLKNAVNKILGRKKPSKPSTKTWKERTGYFTWFSSGDYLHDYTIEIKYLHDGKPSQKEGEKWLKHAVAEALGTSGGLGDDPAGKLTERYANKRPTLPPGKALPSLDNYDNLEGETRIVTDAETGRVIEGELGDIDTETIAWSYTAKNKQIKSATFRKSEC